MPPVHGPQPKPLSSAEQIRQLEAQIAELERALETEQKQKQDEYFRGQAEFITREEHREKMTKPKSLIDEYDIPEYTR